MSRFMPSPQLAPPRLPSQVITTLESLPSDIVDMIFDQLERLVPLTLIHLSKGCYLRVSQNLYRDVTVSKKNATKLFYGMCVDQTAELPYPYGGFIFESRKAKAFRHTRRITFKDIWAAEAMVMAAREYPTHEFGFMSTENAYPLLFPSARYVLLGRDILRSLPDAAPDVNVAEQRRWNSNHVLPTGEARQQWIEHHGHWYVTSGEFEDLLFRMVDPQIICFDMIYADSSRAESLCGARVTNSLSIYRPKGRVVIHWYYCNYKLQEPLFREVVMGTPVIVIFHAEPPEDEPITDPKSIVPGRELSSLSPMQRAEDLAAAVDKLIDDLARFSKIIPDENVPGEEEKASCSIQLCMPNALSVREIWRNKNADVGDDTEGLSEFTAGWENIIEFKDTEDIPPCRACGRK